MLTTPSLAAPVFHIDYCPIRQNYSPLVFIKLLLLLVSEHLSAPLLEILGRVFAVTTEPEWPAAELPPPAFAAVAVVDTEPPPEE